MRPMTAAISIYALPLEIELPVPPSINDYYFKGKILRPEGRQYRQRVFARVLPMLERTNGGRWLPRFAEGNVAVEIAWYRKRRTGDLDNLLKCLLDSLQKLVYTKDSQIAHLTIFRHDKPYDGEPRLEVQVRAWP